jgi:hypothetical protein
MIAAPDVARIDAQCMKSPEQYLSKFILPDG